MPIGEVFLLDFFRVLFDKLASAELLQIARQEKIDSVFENWRIKLEIVKSVLADAEEKQLTDSGVRYWMRDLQDLAYDMEDILDEFSTEALGRKLMAQRHTSQVRNLISATFSFLSPEAIKFGISMGSKVKSITRRLEQLCSQRMDLRWNEEAAAGRYMVTTDAFHRLPTTSLPTAAFVYGRDEDKAKILDMVFSDEPSYANFRVIPIVGMGGLGKTTLALEVYNDEAVNQRFDLKAWVCVSVDFDVLRISRAILEYIMRSACELTDLERVQNRLKDAVVGKRFLLILDDVWSQDYASWEILKAPFLYGVPGSKIVVTTRREEVALTMGSCEYHDLNLLSDDDCWSVFMSYAFESVNLSACQNLELIRKKVVEMCKGLPLVARNLGGLLRSTRNDGWEDILNMSDLSEETEILPEAAAGRYMVTSVPIQRLPTTSLPTEPVVYGREEDKAKILNMVFNDEPSDANFHVIPIVGMRGVGKTTLAREAYNDKAVNQHFVLKAWVCVSDDFDLLRISKMILESIMWSTSELTDLNGVQIQLKGAVVGKRFLLILDDVWSQNFTLWETFKAPFMYAAPGSRIVVTTCSREVALTMGSSEYYNLNLLSDDDCWSLFTSFAFHEWQDIGACTNLELIRKKVVEKCKGLPLVAKTLGGRLRSRRYDVWEDVLYSEMSDLSEETEILPEAAAGRYMVTSAAFQRPPTSSVPTEPVVYGRDEDKAKILDMVFSDELSDDNFGVISIVGMGGLGKSTLAREVYNDKAVNQRFDLKAWVCVSDDFDVFRISKAILEDIMGSACELTDLNRVQNQLKELVIGKRFLLILDDVWSQNFTLWESLKAPFCYGAPGSKIVVTTRSVEVALTMGSREYIILNLLSDDDCWSVFKRFAFHEGQDIGARTNLELIYKKVVEKCKGLPLVARTLGGLLRSKRYDEWEDILNSKIWDLSEETEILPALRLSYHHLPEHLKRCFAYCSIFPKDYEFEAKELVLLWIADGLVQNQNNRQLEDLGHAYFDDLLLRSFFQQSSGYNNSKFGMHDLINDLAQSVSGERSFRLEHVLESSKPSEWFQRARHSSYICGAFDGKSKFEVFHDTECLRTFLPIPVSDHTPYITNAVISDLLPKLKKLRVLSLRKYCITELPNSIGGLRHLTYLNLSGTMIKSLPESVSLLFNLQILLLKDCSCLTKLPPDMGYLINLLHLDIKNVNLSKMPLGMGRLKYLERLSNFIVGKGLGSQVKDLMELKFLGGELCISGLENISNWENKILSDKNKLDVLQLEWESHFDDSRNEMKEKKVLDMLQPHRNIKNLLIKSYGGIQFPSWVGDSSFSNMVFLRLENCENCKLLPSLGLLHSLRNLCIKGMTGLERIGSEIYEDRHGMTGLMSFQSLEILHFEGLQEWKQWDQQVERFPRLRELSIIDCPKLTGTLPNNLPLLEKLVIRECKNMLVSVSNFPMLCELEIDICKRVLCSHQIAFESVKSMVLSKITDFGSWPVKGFQRVGHFKVVGCENLICLWQNEFCLEKPAPGMHSLTFLKELSIENCPSLVSFPEADLFPLLSVLEIENCNSLQYLPVRMKHTEACLHSLRIKHCDSLPFIVKGQLPSSLKKLSVMSCKNLQCVLDDREDDSTSSAMNKENTDSTSPSLLEYLSISKCPSLTCLSSRGQLPASLKHLGIRGCPELTILSERGQLPAALKHIEISDCSELTNLSSGGRLPEALQNLNIADCRNLESVAERFHNNRSLEFLLIRNCKSLGSIPEGLHNLSGLRKIFIWDCPSLRSFPEAGLPNTSLTTVSIERCNEVEALPNHMHTINSLEELVIRGCPSIRSFPEQGFPTNLTSLSISDLNIYNSLLNWGFDRLAILKTLEIRGCCPDAVSFPQEEMGMILPTTLTRLSIHGFPKLKYLSSVGFENLSSLEDLSISDCPELKSFPKVGLPSSLLQLYISGCPSLKKRCKRGRGKYWSKIADIPRVRIDSKFIYDQE